MEPAGVFANWSRKVGYIIAVLTPVAVFLPRGGAALLTLVTPLATAAASPVPGVTNIGCQYPLAVLPFVYGAAAVGARPLTAAYHVGQRKFIVAAATIIAVAGQVVTLTTFAGPFYKKVIADVTCDDYELGLARALRRVPAGAAVCTDERFLPHLAHRRYVYNFGFTKGCAVEPPPTAMLLDRRAHPLSDLSFIITAAENWGLSLTACDGDYAYFSKGASRDYGPLFTRWYGSLEEWQGKADGRRVSTSDASASDGRSALVKNRYEINPSPSAIYPPGSYRFVFLMRAAAEGPWRLAVISARASAAGGDRAEVFTRRTVKVGERYVDGPYFVSFKCDKPFQLELQLFTTAPLYLDAILIRADAYTLANCLSTPPPVTT